MAPRESFGTALRRMRLSGGFGSLRQFAVAVHYSAAYISEIERGIKRPTMEVAERCDEALSANGVLVALVTAQQHETHGRHGSPTPPAGGQAEQLGPMPLTVTEIAMAMAHESTSGAAADGSQTLPMMSIEQIQDTAQRLARDYNAGAPLTTLVAARTLRDSARELAERTNKPAQTADLYQAAGQACGVMSVASFDLAIWPAAVEQARAALVYAELIDDQSLQAWSLGMLALTTYWFGHPREAADLANRGIQVSPRGAARARLHSIAARAWAHAGDADRVRASIEAADAERQAIGTSGDDPLHDHIGGEFGWGPARQAMCDASSWLQLGSADLAAAQARLAIQLRSQDTTGYYVDAKAASDLAAAELLRDNLEAVDEVLSPVWSVASEHRSHALVTRLNGVGTRLSIDTRYRDAPRARALVARIEDFVSHSAPRALPPSSDQLA